MKAEHGKYMTGKALGLPKKGYPIKNMKSSPKYLAKKSKKR